MVVSRRELIRPAPFFSLHPTANDDDSLQPTPIIITDSFLSFFLIIFIKRKEKRFFEFGA